MRSMPLLLDLPGIKIPLPDQRHWPRNGKSLGIVNTDGAQLLQNRFVFHELCNRFDSHQMPDMVNALHHRTVDRIGNDVFDKRSIYFEIVYGESFEIGEGGETAAKVVQSKSAAALLQFFHKLNRLGR